MEVEVEVVVVEVVAAEMVVVVVVVGVGVGVAGLAGLAGVVVEEIIVSCFCWHRLFSDSWGRSDHQWFSWISTRTETEPLDVNCPQP